MGDAVTRALFTALLAAACAAIGVGMAVLIVHAAAALLLVALKTLRFWQ
jgi:hypothetical protein